MSVLIIDNYDSFTYNLYQMVQEQTQDTVEVYRNDRITLKEILAKAPKRIILSPGPGHPAIERDFGVCKEVIVRQDELNCPVLGVCLGHQGIAQHLGGSVVRAPPIVHGKTSRIEIVSKSPLFDGLPSTIQAMRYHSLVAEADKMPAELQVTAVESSHKLVMALQHASKPIYGLQFHPESIGTPDGKAILRNFLEKC
jgi:anthranilate synthase component II